MTTPPLHLWNISAPLSPLLGGHRNVAFRTTGRAQDLVFKSTRRSEAAICWLRPVHRLAENAGFHVPKLIPSRNDTLIEAGWTCETFLAGRAFERKDMPRVLPMIEALHSLGVGHAQRPGFLSSCALVTQGKGGDVDLSALPAPLARICKQAWAALAPAPSTIIHADLTPSNLIQYETGEIGLVDWDECRVDLPVFDTGYLAPPRSAQVALALKVWEMACSWQIEPAYARGLVADVYRLVEEL